MASAVLASRNESSWAQSGGGGAGGGGFMGKTPYSHTQLNPNPKKKQKQFHHTSNGNSPAVTQTASDDAYSFNQRPIESTTNVDGLNLGGYMTYNVVSYNKSELHELRSRLVAELEQIRNLKDRIESGQLSTSNPRSHGKSKKLPVNKRPTPSGSSKDQKKLPNGVENRNFGNPKGIIGMESMTKDCRSILGKLMKHKNGWIFNNPVDAEALGLHDYHQIIKRPMDLGTVKSNLAKNFYPTPFEFAADVRLTFNNALLYNPKTDQVHGFAEQLLGRFEEMFRPFQDKLNKLDGSVRREFHPVDELQGSSWNHIPTPERVKKPKATPAPKKQERMQNHSTASTTPSLPAPPPNLPVRQQSPLSTPSPVRAPVATKPQSVATKAPPMGKQPKPRAKDPNKREMSMEEKHKLGIGLQSLPQEKMPQLVQIIRKRNEHLAQDGDEIELDIEALDTETLWELDRFVTNWKKMVSKTKRQALMNNLGPPSASAAASAVTTSVAEADGPTTSEKYESFKKLKKGEVGDEDVEIEDDEPATHFPPVEIEKDEGGGREQDNGGSSSSSSSSSGSSSSSDSDSGSSSGSDSDADDAHS